MYLLPGPAPGARAVVVTHLTVTDPAQVRHASSPPDCRLHRVTHDKATISRDLYHRVGGRWNWVDREDWPMQRWAEWTDRDGHHLLIALVDEQIAGYLELDDPGEGSVEIAYFGVLEEFTGRRIGGWLLSTGLDYAFGLSGTREVRVHTCDLDAPAALANYQARGMRVVAREVEWRHPQPDTVEP